MSRGSNVAFALLAGCGRIGFSGLSDGNGSSVVHGSVLTLDLGPSTPLTNYPLLITLDDGRADRSRIHANADNVRFYDANGMLLGHEIEQPGVAGGPPLLAWVFVPAISGNTTTIHVAYADAPTDVPSASWPPEFVAVWHLDETGTAADATSNHPAAATGTTSTGGEIGAARRFSPTTNDHLTVAAMPAILDGTGFTTSGWIRQRVPGGGNFYGIVTRQFGIAGDNDIYLGVVNDMAIATCETANGEFDVQGGAVGTSWRHLVGVIDGTAALARIYLDGIEIQSLPLMGGALTSSNKPLFLGADRSNNVGAETEPSGDYLDGSIDEVRIESVVRSPAWIAFDDLAMRDQVISYGPVE